MKPITLGRRLEITLFSVFIFAANMRHFTEAFVTQKESPKRSQQWRGPFPLRATQNLWSVGTCLEQMDKIQFVDASWYHKGSRNGRQEFLEGPRIPGSQYFDTSDISASKEVFPELNPKGLKTMFPPKALFAATMDAMGIQPDKQVIVYARRGCWFTPRIWYMLKTYGQMENVGLMQGSIEDWMEKDGPVDIEPLEDYDIWAKDLMSKLSDIPSTKQTTYQVAETARSRLITMDEVLRQLDKSTTEEKMSKVIVDTRGSSYRKRGHMPGAIHIPYSSLVKPDNSLQLKERGDLTDILQANGIPDDEPILLTCGSGVSVCHMALVLEECGYPPPFIYDGSWNEWGSDPDTPKVIPTQDA